MMTSAQIIAASASALTVAIFLYFLVRRNNAGVKNGKRIPSMAGSLAAFFEGDERKALEEMKTLALSGRGTPEIYFSAGFLYRKIGDCTKAAQIHEILLGSSEIDDNYKSLIMTELAKDYLCSGMPLKTLAVLNKIRGAEKMPENMLLFAKAHLAAGNFDEAASYCSRYTKTSDSSIKGLYCKCMIEKAKAAKNHAGILKAAKSALEENKNCRPALFITAAVLRKEGRHTKALDIYKTAITKGLVRDMEDMKSIEAAFIESGEETALSVLLNSVLAEKAGNPFIAAYTAKHYEELGEKERAKEILRLFLKNTPSSKAAVKAYAALTGDGIIENALKNEKNFSCTVCKTEYETYSDDCAVCGSFDSIWAK